MKRIDEYRDGGLARSIAATIAREAISDRQYHFMEFCGGHTDAISRYGIEGSNSVARSSLQSVNALPTLTPPQKLPVY